MSRSQTERIRALADGVRGRSRSALGRAITLVESTRPEHRRDAARLIQELMREAQASRRIGITGVPGVGKSTTIDQLGMNLIAAGHRVAVLAVDPSSTRSGGSILGDKTRMGRLSQSPDAFIRPSPTSGTLGGVARRTRETVAIVEAAGFDVVLIETVGVGQSEVAVAGMVDFFLVMLLAGGGDDLQGIKKGIIELADMIAINKADGDNAKRAVQAAAEYRGALNILAPSSPDWMPPVLAISGRDNLGLAELWGKIEEHRALMSASGALARRRQDQAVAWLNEMLRDELIATALARPAVAARLPEIEAEVRAGRMAPSLGAELLAAIVTSGAST